MAPESAAALPVAPGFPLGKLERKNNPGGVVGTKEAVWTKKEQAGAHWWCLRLPARKPSLIPRHINTLGQVLGRDAPCSTGPDYPPACRGRSRARKLGGRPPILADKSYMQTSPPMTGGVAGPSVKVGVRRRGEALTARRHARAGRKRAYGQQHCCRSTDIAVLSRSSPFPPSLVHLPTRGRRTERLGPGHKTSGEIDTLSFVACITASVLYRRCWRHAGSWSFRASFLFYF